MVQKHAFGVMNNLTSSITHLYNLGWWGLILWDCQYVCQLLNPLIWDEIHEKCVKNFECWHFSPLRVRFVMYQKLGCRGHIYKRRSGTTFSKLVTLHTSHSQSRCCHAPCRLEPSKSTQVQTGLPPSHPPHTYSSWTHPRVRWRCPKQHFQNWIFYDKYVELENFQNKW